MAKKKNWIKGAIKNPGAFSSAAKRAGMSTAAYAQQVLSNPRASDTQKKRAQLALTLMSLSKKRK